ncbi:MAG TPA: hypothetical protein G4O11_01170 [Anaerolineae bacterium]|nr:hypothetical protein [Anaerolineae bacterium]
MPYEKSRFPSGSDQLPSYEIRIRGKLDGRWSSWFNNLTITLTHTSNQSPITILIGSMADQAALRGILCKLWDLNLKLISVRLIEVDDEEGR